MQQSLSLTKGHPEQVKFELDGEPVSMLDKDPHKFMGSTLTFSNDEADAQSAIKDHVMKRINFIDEFKIHSEYKVWNIKYSKYFLQSSKFI